MIRRRRLVLLTPIANQRTWEIENHELCPGRETAPGFCLRIAARFAGADKAAHVWLFA